VGNEQIAIGADGICFYCLLSCYTFYTGRKLIVINMSLDLVLYLKLSIILLLWE